jgi:hypothetical protein
MHSRVEAFLLRGADLLRHWCQHIVGWRDIGWVPIQAFQPITQHQRTSKKGANSLRLGHAFCEKRPCAHAWPVRGGIAEERLRYGDVCGVFGIVKGLDMERGGGVAGGSSSGHDEGQKLKVERCRDART